MQTFSKVCVSLQSLQLEHFLQTFFDVFDWLTTFMQTFCRLYVQVITSEQTLCILIPYLAHYLQT